MEIASLKPRSHLLSSSPTINTDNVISSTLGSGCPTWHNSIPPNHKILTQAEQHTSKTVLSSPSSDSERIVPIKNRDFYGQQTQPFQGRNLCLERNLVQVHQSDQSNEEKTIRKCSLANGNHLITTSVDRDQFYGKEYEVLVEELLNKSVSGVSSSMTSCGGILPKRHNYDKKNTRWASVRDMFHIKVVKENQEIQPNKNIHLNMMESNPLKSKDIKPNNIQRPKNLDVFPIVVNQSSTSFKTIDHTNESFAVVQEPSKVFSPKSACLEESSEGKILRRQHSLEVFQEVFGATKGNVARLRDVSLRIKTPGDVPASVRKIRTSKTLSLYDDRIMSSTQIYDDLSNSI
jgi:bone morphogenetic protein receptor type-2